jgi:hypothetical protein
VRKVGEELGDPDESLPTVNTSARTIPTAQTPATPAANTRPVSPVMRA